MSWGQAKRRKVTTVAVLIAVLVAMAIILALGNPIPQDLEYHQFGDQRSWLGIKNTLNVLSNIPYLAFGVWGIIYCVVRRKELFNTSLEATLWITVFVGSVLAAPGSMWYHLDPNNVTLFWDRIAIALTVGALFSALICERFSPAVSLGVAIVVLLFSLGSVIQWRLTDDLRLYVITQFYPMLAVPTLIVFLPVARREQNWVWIALFLYILAKLFELHDLDVYRVTHVIGGHMLKHLFAALGVACLIGYLSPHLSLDLVDGEKCGPKGRTQPEGQ